MFFANLLSPGFLVHTEILDKEGFDGIEYRIDGFLDRTEDVPQNFLVFIFNDEKLKVILSRELRKAIGKSGV